MPPKARILCLTVKTSEGRAPPTFPAPSHTGSLTEMSLHHGRRLTLQPLALAHTVRPAWNACPPLSAWKTHPSLRCNSDLTLFPPESSPTTLVPAQTLTLFLTPGPSLLPNLPTSSLTPLQSISTWLQRSLHTLRADPALPAHSSAVAPYCTPSNISFFF